MEVAFDKDAPLKAAAQAYFYEWDGNNKKWTKLMANDPEPPILPAGKYDGQIIEIKKL